MSKNYSGEGKVVNYTAAATHSAGDAVAINGLLAVLLSDCDSGDVVAAQIDGVFNLPAVNGDAFTQGETVTWDVSANSGVGRVDDAAASPATGDLTLGCVVMETVTAGADDEPVAVKLNVAYNTIT